VRAQLERQADSSPFLRSLGVAARVQVVPAGVPVAPVGAALTAREAAAGRLAEPLAL
jgi:hypothetical protein